MWLLNSSIGRKFLMSLSGIFLILFLTFHMAMNLVAIISPEGYNAICHFLGANWYALVGTAVLAGGFLLHILFAFWLYWQNLKARGGDAYAVTSKPKSVEWASQNMLALGIVVVAFLVLHLWNFWAKMQLVEVLHGFGIEFGELDRVADGIYHIQNTFACPITVLLYLVGLGALWFHLTHGFWSALQSIGINNQIWFNRWKCIGNIFATVVILGFVVVVLWFYFQSIMC
ncbi:MAG: succinate dehydrogenase/fumarate reductase cytochrome b subunit [Prevotellaceae bacterium]|jgi:succinate dehydrogenase / fumarate reductase cytochrome b subunit|nr:succinate dehydrogenase/fumarate reductase cytochrome b subunit [Prevotellaceae bacterium]